MVKIIGSPTRYIQGKGELKNLANKIYNLDIDDDLGKITYKFRVKVNEDN